MEPKQRLIQIPGTSKRLSLKLDVATWSAIDWLSENAGQPWHEWCADVLRITPAGENMTAAIRTAAMKALLLEKVFHDRAESACGLQATGFRLVGMCYRGIDFDEAVDKAVIEGRADLTSVEVMAGIDEHGQLAYFIRNKLVDAPHMLISTPFTPMQWLEALGS